MKNGTNERFNKQHRAKCSPLAEFHIVNFDVYAMLNAVEAASD